MILFTVSVIKCPERLSQKGPRAQNRQFSALAIIGKKYLKIGMSLWVNLLR